MAVVAALILFVGIAMIASAGLLALLSADDLRWARRLRRTAPTPVGSWGGGLVSAEAVTECGAAGRQVGPLSGIECAWYEMTVVRTYGEDESHTYHHAGRSPAPPTLADASGRVEIDPRLLVDRQGMVRTDRGTPVTEVSSTQWTWQRDATPPPWLTPAIGKHMRKGHTAHLHEVRLPRGRKVFAMGRVTGGRLRTGLITPERWADLITAREDDLRLMTRTIPVFFVLGLLVAAGGCGLLFLVTR